jgi:hypothetical protein
MTVSAFLQNWFTQTDPMPYGAGSAYEGSYVYAGSRPTVMTDPGGERFGKANIGSGVNPLSVRSFGRVSFDKHNDSDTDSNVPGDLGNIDGQRDAEEAWCRSTEGGATRRRMCAIAYGVYGRFAVAQARQARAQTGSRGSANAVRHCCWSASLAWGFAESEARGFLDRHESTTSDEIAALEGKGDHQAADAVRRDNKADLFNNEVGISIGKSVMSRNFLLAKREIARRCADAHNSGRLDIGSPLG